MRDDKAVRADLVFDVGMNNGDDTAYYLHRGFRVVAVEADPVLCKQANDRFRDAVADRRLVIVNAAIAEREAELPFWICDTHSHWSSFNREVASRGGAAHHAISVKGRRFATLLEEFGVPYFLKVDIEGNDWMCLDGLRGWAPPRYVSVEQSTGVLDRLDELPALGFTGFKIISQHHFLPISEPPSSEEEALRETWARLNSPSLIWRVLRRLGLGERNRRRLAQMRETPGWTFPAGSSGPFGEDTAGSWMPFDQFKSLVNHSNRACAERWPSVFWTQAYDFWADFHMCSDPASSSSKR